MIIGHQKQWEAIKRGWQGNSLSHALLFAGLESLGKRTFALEFVKLINCQENSEKNRPCGQCKSCKMISKLNFPDLLVVEPSKESNNQSSIQISQIRKVQEFLNYKPYSSKSKVVIIDKAERMNRNAQSCLLKTLEEPKGNAILILISSYPEALLPTVYSRCELVKFFNVSREEIKAYLLKERASKEKAQALADVSQGRPGVALNLFLKPEELKKNKETLAQILEVLEADLVSRFGYINFTVLKSNPIKFLEVLQNYLRCVLLGKIGIDGLAGTKRLISPPGKIKDYSIERLKKIIEDIEKIHQLISSTNVNSKLALEVLLMEI